MNIFFTSDQHFGHSNIINLCSRPFKDVDEMNEALVDNYNAVVGPKDFVYHLGDFALGKIHTSLAHGRRLNGRKALIVGNHDRCFAGGKKSGGKTPQEWESVYRDEAGFSHLDTGDVDVYLRGMNLRLSHFPPVSVFSDDVRHIEARPEAPSSGLLLHGHVHTEWKTQGQWVNVGVDAWGMRPVSLDEIHEYYEEVVE